MSEAATVGTVFASGLEPDADAWEDPPRRPPASQSPVLAVEGFEGPLDWLLEMARARKLDLRRLSILALVDCFVDAMQAGLPPGAPAMEMARWAGWTVMATQLTELRSKLLLPADQPDAKAALEQAEEQRRHWLGRAEMLAAADWLERQPQLGRDVFARGRPEPARAGQGARPGRASGPDACGDAAEHDVEGLAPEEEYDDLTELLRACLVALRLPAQADGYQPRRLPFWSVGDAVARIRRMLGTLPDGALLEAFLPEIPDAGPGFALRRKAAHAATLIAGLELARDGGITLDQDVLWQPIHIA